MKPRHPSPRTPVTKVSVRVPAFAPVPLRYRADGWTPGRQADFLGHLSPKPAPSPPPRAMPA